MSRLNLKRKFSEFLNYIPFLRGQITRWRIKRQKKLLLQSYNFIYSAIQKRLFISIDYDESGCKYTLPDGRVFLFNPNKSASWLYSIPITGTFEKKETEYLTSLVKSEWVCIDVGGCFGWYTVLLSTLVGTGGSVHVFEPIPDNFTCLNSNLILNKCTNVCANNFALSDIQQDSVEIFVPKLGVSGSLQAHDSRQNCNVMKIKTSTLDSYVSSIRLKRLDFLKADIEGAEYLLLQGGRDTLSKFKPILMLEVQATSTRLFGYDPIELFNFLRDIGYDAFIVNENSEIIGFNPLNFKGTLPDYNFIFKPKQDNAN